MQYSNDGLALQLTGGTFNAVNNVLELLLANEFTYRMDYGNLKRCIIAAIWTREVIVAGNPVHKIAH